MVGRNGCLPMTGRSNVDDVLRNIPELSAGLGILFASAYAVRRIMRQDKGYEELIERQESEIERKDRRISELEGRLDE